MFSALEAIKQINKHRKDSIESCNLVIEFLKKDAPFWKKEFYSTGNEWLKNFS